MAKPVNLNGSERDTARRKAQNHFELAEARTTLVKQMVDAERVALDSRTAKLRALRLAKEEADRVEAANAPPPAAKLTKTRKKKPVA
jgi:hypothetical protein